MFTLQVSPHFCQGKRKLCYAIPWPKTIVGTDMRCTSCRKHFMSHDTAYVDSLPSEEQHKSATKGYGAHMSIIWLLRTGMTVAQVERYMEGQVREHYLMLKSQYLELWDKVQHLHMIIHSTVNP